MIHPWNFQGVADIVESPKWIGSIEREAFELEEPYICTQQDMIDSPNKVDVVGGKDFEFR